MCNAPEVNVIGLPVRGLSWSKGTTKIVMSFRDILKNQLYEKPQHVLINNFI